MGFFDMFSKKNSKPSYGVDLCRLILEFLRRTETLKSTAFTFTEMYAFMFLLIDSAMYMHQISSRATISNSIMESYVIALKMAFEKDNEPIFLDAFDSRVNEYAEMTMSGKEPSDFLEKLGFYLYHSSSTDEFFFDGSAFLIGDAFSVALSRAALADFYVNSLFPFVNTIISEER